MNDFPAMNEEQRKSAILCAQNVLNASWANEHMKLIAKIALAALTTKPAFYVHESDTHRINEECGAAVWAHRVKTDGDIGVYTAAPVPVLKLNNEKLAREIVCRLVDVGEADPEVVGIHQAWVLNKLNGVN